MQRWQGLPRPLPPFRPRLLAEGVAHWSLALDGTTVGGEKVMSATWAFPEKGVHFWAPPMAP